MESEVCAVPGESKISQSLIVNQTEASKEINSIFPDGLRARVLEFVQFKNTARMDDLGEHHSYPHQLVSPAN
jgi:alpha-1,3-glucosyltransferase